MSAFLRKKDKKNKKKVATYNLNEEQIEAIKKQATMDAIDQCFIMMMAFPTMVIHDKMNDIWVNKGKSETREERFMNHVLELYDSFLKGYITIDDLLNTIKDETGVELRCRSSDWSTYVS